MSVYQFICLLPMAGRTTGPIKNQTWHRDSCSPKEYFSQGQGQGHLQLQRPAGPRQLTASRPYSSRVPCRLCAAGVAGGS